MEIDELEALRERVQEARRRMKALYLCHMKQDGTTYEACLEAAKAFCELFSEYHAARYGKPKRLDPRYVMRAA